MVKIRILQNRNVIVKSNEFNRFSQQTLIGKTVISVSYTHLDVYKRQPLFHMPHRTLILTRRTPAARAKNLTEIVWIIAKASGFAQFIDFDVRPLGN